MRERKGGRRKRENFLFQHGKREPLIYNLTSIFHEEFLVFVVRAVSDQRILDLKSSGRAAYNLENSYHERCLQNGEGKETAVGLFSISINF